MSPCVFQAVGTGVVTGTKAVGTGVVSAAETVGSGRFLFLYVSNA